MTSKIDNAMRLINQIGSDTYIVGGAVRDIIMGNEPNDIDIATGQDVAKLAKSDLHTYDIGQSANFGIIGMSFQGEEYEIAQFRSDGVYSDSRHPDSVNLCATISDDAERRDFTINAMYIDSDGRIVDLHNGQMDIKNKIIRTVGDPNTRFNEDALRIIRAHRFAAKYNFKIDCDTMNAMIECRHLLKNIAIERISQEFIKVAKCGGKAMAKFIKDMIKTDVIRYVLPEILDTIMYDHYYGNHPEGAMVFDRKTDKYVPYSISKHGIPPCGRYEVDNGTVFDHIMAALNTYDGNDMYVTLGILFHDIGKPESAELHSSRKSYTFIGHDKIGVTVFNDIAKRMKFSSTIIDIVSYCIKYHMRFHAIPKKASKIIPIRQSKYYPILKQVAYADDSCRGEAFDADHLNEVFDAIERIYEVFGTKEAFDARMKELVDGNSVMSIRPELKGNQIGKMMEATKTFIIEREFRVTKADVEEFVKETEIK